MRRALAGAAWWAVFILLVALGAHILTVEFLPSVLMAREMNRLAGARRVNTAIYLPPAAEAKGSLAAGDPNMLVTACVFDLTQQNLRVHATVPLKGHWSITGYAENSRPFFFLSNEGSQNNAFNRILASPGSLVSAAGGASVVKAPSFRGILLIRTRIDAQDGAAAGDRIRRSVSCEPIPR